MINFGREFYFRIIFIKTLTMIVNEKGYEIKTDREGELPDIDDEPSFEQFVENEKIRIFTSLKRDIKNLEDNFRKENQLNNSKNLWTFEFRRNIGDNELPPLEKRDRVLIAEFLRRIKKILSEDTTKSERFVYYRKTFINDFKSSLFSKDKITLIEYFEITDTIQPWNKPITSEQNPFQTTNLFQSANIPYKSAFGGSSLFGNNSMETNLPPSSIFSQPNDSAKFSTGLFSNPNIPPLFEKST